MFGDIVVIISKKLTAQYKVRRSVLGGTILQVVEEQCGYHEQGHAFVNHVTRDATYKDVELDEFKEVHDSLLVKHDLYAQVNFLGKVVLRYRHRYDCDIVYRTVKYDSLPGCLKLIN